MNERMLEIQVNEIKTKLRIQGSENQPTLIYIHSNPGNSNDLHPQNMESLSENFQILSFDRPGHGKSETKEYGFEANEKIILAIKERLNLSDFILMGHSWGAAFSLWYASRHPEDLQALYLVNPLAYPRQDEEDPRAALKTLKIPGMFSILKSKIESQMKSYFEKCFAGEALPDSFLESQKLSKENMIAMLKDKAAMNETANQLTQIYSEIQTPCILLASKNDQVAPLSEQAERLYQVLPQASLISEPTGGHAMPYQENFALVQTAQLLRQNSPKVVNQ